MHLISRSLFLCSLIIASLLFTQINAQVVTGRVIDAKTNLPIEFANISIVNEAIGTISNGSGQFAINIPSNMRNRELAISFIGYETKTFSISQLSSKLLVKLTPANITIEAVTVRPDSTMRLSKKAASFFMPPILILQLFFQYLNLLSVFV
jgi:hypothetical protein